MPLHASRLTLRLPTSGFGAVLRKQPFLFLDITVDHAHAIAELPLHHRDPFDRMRIAQAGSEGLVILTHDEHFKS